MNVIYMTVAVFNELTCHPVKQCLSDVFSVVCGQQYLHQEANITS